MGNQVEKLKNGFRVHFTALNTRFSEYDDGDSYLKPVGRHLDILYKKITGHILIYVERFHGLRRSIEHLVIIDDTSEKEIRKRCLEEAKKVKQY